MATKFDYLSAPPPASKNVPVRSAPPMMPPRTPTPPPGYVDRWSDLLPWSEGYNKPARAGPQSTFDWFSKSYNPSPADLAKIYGDAWALHTPSLALQGAQALGAPTGGFTPEGYRRGLQEAKNAAGPRTIPMTIAGYATQPLTYATAGGADLAGATALPLAERFLPGVLAKLAPKAISGGLQSSVIGGLHTAGEGGSPKQIAQSAAINLGLGALVTSVLSPLAKSPVTSADVVAKTTADLRAAQRQSADTTTSAAMPGATQSQADALAAAREAFVKDQTSKGVSEWQARVNSMGSSNQDAIMRQYGGGATGPAQAAAEAAAAQQARSAAANARVQAAQGPVEGAQTLQKWHDMVALDQAKAVQKEAADMASQVDSTDPLWKTYQGIATAAGKKPPDWVPRTQKMLPLAGAAAGEGASMLIPGLPPHLSSVGSAIGTLGSLGLGKMYPTTDLAPVLQQQFARASKPMTGYATNPGGDSSKLAQALMYIYQNSQNGPQSQQP